MLYNNTSFNRLLKPTKNDIPNHAEMLWSSYILWSFSVPFFGTPWASLPAFLGSLRPPPPGDRHSKRHEAILRPNPPPREISTRSDTKQS